MNNSVGRLRFARPRSSYAALKYTSERSAHSVFGKAINCRHIAILVLLFVWADVATAQPASNSDFDGDGLITGSDFLAWQRGFGTADAHLADGDANGDGLVDATDLETWKAQYGQATGTVTSFSVPEPALELWASITLGYFITRARRRSIFLHSG